MPRSMTAYGRFCRETASGHFSVEIHSLNRKMLDLTIFLPKDLLRFETDVRKWIMQQVERGQVTVRITVQHKEGEAQEDAHTLKQLHLLKRKWEKIACDLGFDSSKELTLQFLVDQVQECCPSEERTEDAEIRAILEEALGGALRQLIQMKEQEGKALLIDIENRLQLTQRALDAIAARKGEPLPRYRKKLQEALEQIGPLTREVEDRIYREIALVAERADITEEIVRIHSHMEQFKVHLASPHKSIGRTLEFLLQEINREVNTLAAKSLDRDISSSVVHMKSELEKIREQVQNIE